MDSIIQVVNVPPYGRLQVILTGILPRIRSGKYVVGHPPEQPEDMILAFDPTCKLHRHIAAKFDLDVIGGGWLTIDPVRKRAILSGLSEEFGEDPNREASQKAIKFILTDYEVVVKD